MRTIVAFAALAALLAVAHAGNVPRTTPGMRQGSPSAPVMIEMFVDLQCPDCKAAWPIMKQVLQQMGPNNVYFSLNIIPLWMHRQAADMARAASIVARHNPKAYFNFVDYIFNQQSLYYNAAFFNKTQNDLYNLLGSAVSQFGIDQSYFFTQMTSDSNFAYTDFNIVYGLRKGVAGTPTYFVNGFPVDFDESTSVAEWVQFLNKLLYPHGPTTADN
eukprot:TRINITY_DN8862_c0_g1_i1.p2 TRINITY_DN8862_c0_g1~~TRINITY_DN8862_c0_g1_i1.p2  ORF type:complete len:216 (+),score=63.31 TRINITY_DN8862_c0_g1_i1:187-834(+)